MSKLYTAQDPEIQEIFTELNNKIAPKMAEIKGLIKTIEPALNEIGMTFIDYEGFYTQALLAHARITTIENKEALRDFFERYPSPDDIDKDSAKEALAIRNQIVEAPIIQRNFPLEEIPDVVFPYMAGNRDMMGKMAELIAKGIIMQHTRGDMQDVIDTHSKGSQLRKMQTPSTKTH